LIDAIASISGSTISVVIASEDVEWKYISLGIIMNLIISSISTILLIVARIGLSYEKFPIKIQWYS